ncbi:MAG: malto-oligosyltrehalose synthase [Bacteroidota bacterium]
MTRHGEICRLAELYGIEAEYTDVGGRRHVTGDETRQRLLAAMGLSLSDALAGLIAEAENRDWRSPLPPVLVRTAATAPLPVDISLPASQAGQEWRWALHLENGDELDGSFTPGELEQLAARQVDGSELRRWRLLLPPLGVTGYHRLAVGAAGAEPVSMSLIVVPDRCHQPAVLADGGRIWGPAVQLYSLRSRRNWGIGDFTDLATLVERMAAAGACIVGLNPLHALFNDGRCSPYSPSSRLFINALYIDVEAVSDFRDAEAARQLAATPEFQQRLAQLRAVELVDYPLVAATKLAALRLAYAYFRQQHLAEDTARARAWQEFRQQGGEALERQALFEALQAHFSGGDALVWGWPAWPEAWRSPQAEAVKDFARTHGEEIEFHIYLQWLAEQQLRAVGEQARQCCHGVGLYHDLAVGIDPGGAEAWANRGLYALDAHVGAPPDDFSPRGQDWGLPPLVPWRLRQAAYAPWIATLRASMRHGGALRIDHVMALLRLFWVPAGQPPAAGAYVRYPVDDLLGILALESSRQRCLVIGEDLGTVPEALRPALAALGVLSYRPLLFERAADNAFKPPADYPRQALAAISTHDLPTLAGFWQGRDIDARAELGLFPSRELVDAAWTERRADRRRLLQALAREGLWPADLGEPPAMTTDLAVAVHAFMARSAAQVLMIQAEDIFGLVDQANLPGSNEPWPNWRRKLPLELEDWAADPRLQATGAVLRAERPRPAAAPAGRSPPPAIPRATYRLQFNRDFTLAQATALLPYLDELGISHCYASPYLKARPGSSHGYDIVDHNALNPEIGSAEDLQHFVDALAQRGMGQILDMVPNHMGIMGSDNQWWLDVLENGRASAYAEYFDIDWEAPDPQLRGKVLLPLLGDHYGAVLDRGDIRLAFDAGRGEFSLHYFQHRLPIDPSAYPRLIEHRLEQLGAVPGVGPEPGNELRRLADAFAQLPPRSALAAADERQREQVRCKQRLVALCAMVPEVARHLADTVAEFNQPSEAAGYDLLHELIKAQAYRLAHWRVAADDINYRRFFDISDLAALRMENPAAFADTHRLVLDLLAKGQVHGLRIDHADGLFDPGRYFRQLQAAAGGGQPAQMPQLPLYLVIEKILAEHERLPEDWPIHGSTGYRFSGLVNNLFVDSRAERRMSRIYAGFTELTASFDDIAYAAKKLVIRSLLHSELNMLAERLTRIAAASRHTCDFTRHSLSDALAEVVASFPVYRTYLTVDHISATDRRHIEWAVAVARRRSPVADLSIFDFIRAVLTGDIAAGKSPAERRPVWEMAMRFQQYTAPVTAKGIEDTAFYRYLRLVSLNDVGGDPRRFGISPAAFHAAVRTKAERWPHAMLAGSTHDSKRGEDVRARINVLSEIPAAWKLSLRHWRRINRSKKRLVDERPAPSANDEYLIYQTLVGTWPLRADGREIDDAALAAYRERLVRYMQKVVREAKEHSSWIKVDAEYEAAVTAFVEALLAPGGNNLFLADFAPAIQRLARFGLINALAQTLLRLTAPGVPDIYQGCETWQFTLVDPDNRQPVDYGERQRRLAEIKALHAGPPEGRAARLQVLSDTMEDGRIKLYLIWCALQLRRRWPDLFASGDYLPLAVVGQHAEHALAFARRLDERLVVAVVPRLLAKLQASAELGATDWADTRVELPERPATVAQLPWCNVLTGERIEPPADGLPLARLLAAFPVALLACGKGSDVAA